MKQLVLLKSLKNNLIFFLLLPLVLNAQNPTQSEYEPNANTTVKTIYLNYVFIRYSNTDYRNFDYSNSAHKAYLDGSISVMNNVLANLTNSSPSTCPIIPDSKIRFKLKNVYYITDAALWDNDDWGSVGGLTPPENSALKGLSVFLADLHGIPNDAINIFFTESACWYNSVTSAPPTYNCCTSSIKGKVSAGTTQSGVSVVHSRNLYTDYLAKHNGFICGQDGEHNNCGDNLYTACCNTGCEWYGTEYKGLLHEIGHVLTLGHYNPCDNIMVGTGNLTRTYFNPNQLQTIHKILSLNSQRNYIEGCPYSSDNPFVIDYNRAWYVDIRLYSDLIVSNNSTFTLTGKIRLPSQATITVQSGSKLIIDGGLITSSCSDLWQGIIAEPGSIVELKNGATIENAQTAITAQGTANIKISSSTFNNNQIAIYYYFNTNTSNTITNSTFETTAQMYSDVYEPETFIKSEFSTNVTIKGCTFKNSSGNTNVNILGKGIMAYSSGIKVSGCLI